MQVQFQVSAQSASSPWLLHTAHCPPFAAWLFSQPYCTAMALACIEYWAELWLWPGLKHALRPAVALGLAAVVSGELLRKAAMVWAWGRRLRAPNSSAPAMLLQNYGQLATY